MKKIIFFMSLFFYNFQMHCPPKNAPYPRNVEAKQEGCNGDDIAFIVLAVPTTAICLCILAACAHHSHIPGVGYPTPLKRPTHKNMR